MADLKLAKLPDRTPVKMTIFVTPDLSEDLADYSEAYKVAYGQSESVADLIPYMLRSFLDCDRAFVRQRSKQ